MPSKRHHFVPRFHLNHFATAESAIHICQYTKESGDPIRASTKDIGCRKGFYSLNTEGDGESVDHEMIESRLADLDGMGAFVIGKLAEFNPIDVEELNSFCVYASALFIRTPSFVRRLKCLNQPVMQEIADRAVKFDIPFRERLRSRFVGEGHMDELQFEDFLKKLENGAMEVSPSHSFMIAAAMAQIPKVAEVFQQMSWTFFTPKNDKAKFVICDHPVFCCDPVSNRQSGFGIASPNVEVTLPVSKNVCAVGAITGSPSGVFLEASDDVVGEINRRTIVSADCYVYGSEMSDELNQIVKEFKGSSLIVVSTRLEDAPSPGGLALHAVSHLPVTGFAPLVLEPLRSEST